MVTGELPAGLKALALEPGVELGRLRLALERPQPRAGLTLDVERPVKVVLGVAELELSAAPACKRWSTSSPNESGCSISCSR